MSRRFERPKDGKDHYSALNPATDLVGCGLEQVADLDDPNSCYDFNSLIFRRDIETGAVYAAHDSGCSCPSPFEHVHGLDDMTLISSIEHARTWIEEYQGRSEYSPNGVWPVRDVDAALEKIKTALVPSGAIGQR